MDKEQAKAKKTYKSKFNNYIKRRFNNRFEERFKQYIIKCEEGNNEDSEAEANNTFENLILDIKSKLDLEEPTNKKESESGIIYLTAFGELTLNKTISISIILANKAFSYLLILEDITKPTPATNPFIYTLNISSSRYTSDIFLGIIVDIGASKKSTTSYG
jgi:sulfite reductase alpha subunit-like flavoprotein